MPQPSTKRSAFTLIEVLVVIAIIGILAAIIVPVAGSAKKTALKRRAMVEMNSIKVAALQFYADHKYMPWGDPDKNDLIRVGEDTEWSTDEEQVQVMRWLTGENPLKKSYLQIPERSRKSEDSLLFIDPWGQSYKIQLDRNMDGAVLPAMPFGGDYVKERVLVYSPGPPDDNEPMKTFDVP